MEFDYLDFTLNSDPAHEDIVENGLLNEGTITTLQNDKILENVTIVDDGIPETNQNSVETVEVYTIIDEGIVDETEETGHDPVIFDEHPQNHYSADMIQNPPVLISLDPVQQHETIIETPTKTNELQNSNEMIKTTMLLDENMQQAVDSSKELLQMITDADLLEKISKSDEMVKNNSIIDSNQVFSPPLTQVEIIRNATIIDEGIKLCPLCRNEVRLFFINYDEKILMCENTECDYPFGYSPVTYVKNNENIQCDEDVSSVTHTYYGKLSGPKSITSSNISSKAWSDIDKMNTVNETEDKNYPRPEVREYYKHNRNIRKKHKKIDNPKIMRKLEAIAKIHEELKVVNEPCIKNEKWIKNLLGMQQSSGLSLLKPEEMSMFKQIKPVIGLGELKIDINRNPEEASAIKIEISNVHSSSKNV